MQDRNIANIFVAETQAKRHEGILVGFNFEGFIFVIVDVVALDACQSIENLSDILSEN